jgi:cytochrome b561
MVQQRPRWKSMLATICLDLALTGSMLALFSVNLTGLKLHEWLGLGLCILIPAHLLVNWSWLAATTRSVLGPMPWRVRARYLLNASLFVAIVVVTLSGLVISEALFPNLSRMVGNQGFWHPLHTMASNATLVLVGLHLGVYWRNITNMVRRLVTREPRDTTVRARPDLVGSRAGV